MKNTDLLRSTGIFPELSEDDLQKVSDLLKEMRVGKDETVFHQGEHSDALYIVQSGRIKSTAIDAVGRERVLGFHTEGQSFGEMALLMGEPRSATAQAVTDSRLLVLTKADFDSFQASNVQVMLQMMKVIAGRQAQATQRPAWSDGAAAVAGPSGGKVFTIFSPKGGVGKSMLAVNLAISLAHKHPESVVLVDLSLTFGHDTLLLNMTPTTSLAFAAPDALKKMGLAEGLAYYLTTHESSSLRILAGSTRPEEGETVTGEAAKIVIEQLKKYFAYVIVDTSCIFSDPVLAAIEQADRLVMVCTPEIAVLRDVRDCQRIFNEVVHLRPEKVVYVMNNVFPYKGLSREQFEDALHQPLYMDLPNGGEVPLKASLRGEAFVETQSGSPIAKAVQKLASQLAEDTASRTALAGQQSKKKGLFGW